MSNLIGAITQPSDECGGIRGGAGSPRDLTGAVTSRVNAALDQAVTSALGGVSGAAGRRSRAGRAGLRQQQPDRAGGGGRGDGGGAPGGFRWNSEPQPFATRAGGYRGRLAEQPGTHRRGDTGGGVVGESGRDRARGELGHRAKSSLKTGPNSRRPTTPYSRRPTRCKSNSSKGSAHGRPTPAANTKRVFARRPRSAYAALGGSSAATPTAPVAATSGGGGSGGNPATDLGHGIAQMLSNTGADLHALRQ